MYYFLFECIYMRTVVTLLVIFLSLTASSIGSPNHDAKILKYFSDIRPEGSYEYAFETDNGIYAEERGTIKDSNSEDVGLSVQGSFLYQSPEGTPIHLTYTADENGFHPQGEHLPTPPPIPPQILRALAWIEEQKRKQQLLEQNDIKEDFFGNVNSSDQNQ